MTDFHLDVQTGGMWKHFQKKQLTEIRSTKMKHRTCKTDTHLCLRLSTVIMQTVLQSGPVLCIACGSTAVTAVLGQLYPCYIRVN